ncbi:MAG: hypothetical protein Q7R35_04390 [Elusimicrobiota bacterium]|nr:hypothetical protein [Elusimicrobiota bacterium]
MFKNTLVPVLVLAVMAFSAPRGAAAFDFAKSSEPLLLASVTAVPEAPAPVRAAPKACRPFLLSISVGGVDETVALERVCTPENDAIWAIKVGRAAADAVFVKVSSDKYPADRVKLESRIKSMVTNGISQEDADFIVMKTGPALKQAAASAAPREKIRVLAAATEELERHLARP